MVTQEFNEKYKNKKLFTKILSSKEEYKEFNRDPELLLDYRFNPKHIKTSTKLVNKNITTQTFILYEDSNPVGLPHLF